MKRLFIIGVFLFLILFYYFPAFAEEGEEKGVGDNFIVELEGRYWMPKLNANIKLSDYGLVTEVIGTDIDVVKDLGIKNKGFFSGRIILKLSERNKIRFSYLPLYYSAENAISRSISFGGTTFTAGTVVKTELRADVYDITYEFDAIKGDIGFLGIVVGVKYFDLYGKLESTFPPYMEDGGGQAPIPVIGLAGRIYPIKYFNISGEITGLSVGQASIYDAELAINVNPIKYVGLSGGYRVINISAEGDNDKDKATLRLHGPFVALMARF